MAQATSPPTDRDPGREPPRAAPGSEDAAGLGRVRASAFVVPSLLLVGVFLVFPAIWTIYLGLTNFRLTGTAAAHPKVVGLDNYASAVGDPDFRNALWLTLLYVLGSAVIGQSVLGFVVVWLMREAPRAVRTTVETLVMLAWILPSSVVSFLWIALLDRDAGTLNALLHTPGTAWLISHPLLSVIVFNTWRGTAFSMLLYSAALDGVPPSQLESARLAGASGWQQLRDVVFPHIRGHLLTNLLLISLWTFNDFTPYLITAGGPDGATETLPVFVYRTAISDGRLGFGSAISLLMLLINLVLAVGYLRLLWERRS
ncbi:MAG TPA: sugar ABC transporter permease [Pseudonocardia sp.]|nr:sugar ABC transporter permease [Pseudonocardia sp.]